MPIYEYECCECHEVTEAIQNFSDKPLKKCPKCGGALHKMMSLNSFHLKGGGWYVTDYKGKNSSVNAGEKASKEAPAEKKAKKEKKKAQKSEKS